MNPTTRNTVIERYSFERIDEDFIINRNQPEERPPLSGKKIHLIGLGSVGSILADRLVQAGAGKNGGELHIIDFDRLKTENIGRHLLGVPYLGMKKAKAVSHYLKRTRLATNVYFHDKMWTSPNMHAGADIVIDATGMPNIGAALSNSARAQRKWALATVFVEGPGWVGGVFLYRGIAGEACRTCLEPWIGGNGSNMAPNQSIVLRDNGCGSVYTPYRAAAADVATALACELICDWAMKNKTKTYKTIKLPSAPRHIHASRDETPKSKQTCICFSDFK